MRYTGYITETWAEELTHHCPDCDRPPGQRCKHLADGFSHPRRRANPDQPLPRPAKTTPV